MKEALDIENFEQFQEYLSEREICVASASFRILKGGVSNRTVIADLKDGRVWVFKQALSQLRVPVEWLSPPERSDREARGAEWLSENSPNGAVPSLCYEDPEHHLLAIEAVPEPFENLKEKLLRGAAVPSELEELGNLLGLIHRRSREKLVEVQNIFADRSYFESLRIDPYYSYTCSIVPESNSFFDSLISSTRKRLYTITHGDFSPKNVLVSPRGLHLLDHEVIHFGDGTFDVGMALAHLLSKGNLQREKRKDFLNCANAFWESYTRALTNTFDSEWEHFVGAHMLGILLARVRGKSQVEYLSAEQKTVQCNAVLALINLEEFSVSDLVGLFFQELAIRE